MNNSIKSTTLTIWLIINIKILLLAQNNNTFQTGDTLVFNTWEIDLAENDLIPNIDELKSIKDPSIEYVIIGKNARVGLFSIYYLHETEWSGTRIDTFEVTNLYELIDIHLDSDGDIDYERIGEETKENYYDLGIYIIYFPLDKLSELIAKRKVNAVKQTYWDAFEQNVSINSITRLEGEENYRFLLHGKLVSLPVYKIRRITTIPVFMNETGTYYKDNNPTPNGEYRYVVPSNENSYEIDCRCEKTITIESTYFVNKNISEPIIFDQEVIIKFSVKSITPDNRCLSICKGQTSIVLPFARSRLKKVK